MIVSSRFWRRGWIHPGPRPQRKVARCATVSGGCLRRISRVCLLRMFVQTNYPPASLSVLETLGQCVYRSLILRLRRLGGIRWSQRRSKKERYRSTFVTPQGVGVKVGGNDALVSCIVESPEEMFIVSEYARLVAKGYIVGGRVAAASRGWSQPGACTRIVSRETIPGLRLSADAERARKWPTCR